MLKALGSPSQQSKQQEVEDKAVRKRNFIMQARTQVNASPMPRYKNLDLSAVVGARTSKHREKPKFSFRH